MPTTNSRHRSFVAALCAVLIGPFASEAAPVLDWSLTAGADHSDNMRRVPVNEESDTAVEVGGTLNIDSRRPRLDAEVSSDLRYRSYLDNTFDDEIVGGLDGTLRFTLSPERVHWVVEDHFGQVARDTRLADSPENRQNLNTFVTGPDFTIPLSGSTRLQLQARGAQTDYENATGDHRQYSGNAGLVRPLGGKNALSLNVSSSHVTYGDDFPNGDYDINAAFVRFEGTGARTTFSTDLGYTRLEPDIGDANDGILARVELTRKIGARSTLALRLGREFSDTANVFQTGQSFTGVNTGFNAGIIDAAVSNDPFRADSAYASWSLAARRTTLTMGGSWRRERHETQTALDREFSGLDIGITRRLGTRVSVDLRAAATRDDPTISTVDQKETIVGGGLNWQMGRSFSLQLRLDHARGNSAVGDTRDFEENRGFAGFRYSRGQ